MERPAYLPWVRTIDSLSIPVISSSGICVKKEVDDPVLKLFELGEIDDPGHFIGGEHPVHSRLEKCDGDVPSDLPPDIISREYLNSLPVLLRVRVRVLLGFFS